MKAKFFFLGLCALALAACSIDEVSQVNDTNAISFKATAFETDSTTGYDAFFGEEVDLTSDLIETANGVSNDTYKGYVANATITDPTTISFDVHVPADAAKEIDLGYAATLGQSAGTVGLNFRHALSQVAFKAQNGNTNYNSVVKARRILR